MTSLQSLETRMRNLEQISENILNKQIGIAEDNAKQISIAKQELYVV